MALKIKLSRYGRKKIPFYRVIIAEARSKRDGKYIDLLGYYNPCTNPVTLQINREKAQYWLDKGAKPTKTIAYLLEKENFIWTKDFKPAKPIPVKKKRTKKDRKKEKEALEATAKKEADEKKKTETKKEASQPDNTAEDKKAADAKPESSDDIPKSEKKESTADNNETPVQ